MRKEPALIIGGMIAMVQFMLPTAGAFGLALSPEQVDAVDTILTSLLTLTGAAMIRRSVYSPATVDRLRG